MRADALIRVRVAERTKEEWSAHANQHGVGLSDFVRTSCRLGALIGHRRLTDGLADIASARHDLHSLAAELRQLATEGQLSTDETRAVLARKPRQLSLSPNKQQANKHLVG